MEQLGHGEDMLHHQWRARLKKRRGKAFKSVGMRELNLVAMMDMLTIILVFLLKSYSGSALSLEAKNIEFTESTNMASPEEAVKLTLTSINNDEPGELIIDEKNVLVLDKKKVAQLQRQTRRRNFMIKELYDELKVKSDQAKAEAAAIEGKEFEGNILVIADKETPYWLITSVLFSAAEAAYDKYNLVSIKLNQ